MGMVKPVLAAAAALAFAAVGGRGSDAESRAGPGQARMRRQSGRRRLLDQGRQGPVDRLRRRLLQGARRRHLQRPVEGGVRAALGRRTLRRAEGQEDRRPVAQFDLDDGPRGGFRPDLRRRHLLRRPGLPGAEGKERDLGARPRRRQGVRPEGHHLGAERQGLFRRQSRRLHDGRGRHRRRSRGELPCRQVRRDDGRRIGALRPALRSSRSRATT